MRQPDLRALGAQAGGRVGYGSAAQGILCVPKTTSLSGDQTLRRLPLLRLDRILSHMSLHVQGASYAGACCVANRAANCRTKEQRMSTLYVGVDIAQAPFESEAIDATKRARWHRAYPNTQEGYAKLWRSISAGHAQRVQVCMEATCAGTPRPAGARAAHGWHHDDAAAGAQPGGNGGASVDGGLREAHATGIDE